MEGGLSRRKDKSLSDESADAGYHGGKSHSLQPCMSTNHQQGSYDLLLPKESCALPTVPSTLLTLEEWLARRDRFRVVAPGPPRQLLVRAGPCSDDIASIVSQHIGDEMLEILVRKSIAFSSITIQRQWTEHRGGRDQDLNTLVIKSPSKDPTTWKDAAHEILILFQNRGFESERIEVEIFNAQLAYNNVSTAIGNDELMLQELRTIQPSILEIAKDVVGKSWSSIAFHDRRHRLDM